MEPIQVCFFGGIILVIMGLCLGGKTKIDMLDFLAIILFIVGCAIFIFSIVSLAITPKVEAEYSHYFNIYAIEDTTRIQGSRFYIEEQDRYIYLSDYKDGQKQFWVLTNNSYVKEDASVSPRIEVYRYVPVSKFWKWMKKGYYNNFEYKIIVPPKTLTTEFNVDLKK